MEKHVQATHIANSWMKHLNISVPFSTVPGEEGVFVDPDKITSSDPKKIQEVVHSLSQAAGIGTPQIFRETSEPVNYQNDFEGVYLRRKLLERTPPASEEDIKKWSPIVRKSANRAFYRFRLLAESIGFDADDFFNMGLVHLNVFLHYYAFHGENNTAILYSFLRQRYSEWAKATVRKGRSLTCLPDDVANDEEVDFLSFTPAETISPDSEYETGTYLLISETEQRELQALSDGFFSVGLWENGKQLTEEEIEKIGQQIKNKEVKIVGPLPPEEDFDEEEIRFRARRARAWRELERKLLAMPLEERKAALSMAALSKFSDPEVKAQAYRVCRVRFCESCDKTTFSLLCPLCEKPVGLKFGVDPEDFRIEEEGSSLSESFEPQGTWRASVVATTKDAEAVAAHGLRMPKEEAEAIAAKMREEFFDSLDPILSCPRCKKDKPKMEFGVRVFRNKITGVPEKAARQSYCRSCRSK